jgi:TetR/AcrR family transcriptional repressor of bet genes
MMPKLGMKPIRQKQLIEATIATIGEVGFADTTVSKIGKRAKVSPGIVHHYFSDKDALLEAAMRSLLEQLRLAVVVRLRDARTPLQRAEAIIDGNFASEQFGREAITALLSFWTQALHNPALMRLRRLNVRRARSNLRYSLRHLLPAPDVEAAVTGLIAFIDGLWLYAALSEDGVDIDFLNRTAHGYLERLLTDAAKTADHGSPEPNGVYAWQP